MKLFLAFIVAFALASPAAGQHPHQIEANQAPFEVTFGAVASPVPGGVVIEGMTNLPDGAVLSALMAGGGRIFDRTTIVRKGQFSFDIIPAVIGASYGAIVGLDAFEQQPASVRRALGENGELMRGATVERVAGTSLIVQRTGLRFVR